MKAYKLAAGCSGLLAFFANRCRRHTVRHTLHNYYKRFKRYSFADGKCYDKVQLEASIARLYHTVEKGLSFPDYRPGFGKENIKKLILSMEQYSRNYDINSFVYSTSLSCLHEYIDKNRRHGISDPELENKILKLPGVRNSLGGVIEITPVTVDDTKKMDYKTLMTSRHSIRHFADQPVSISLLKEAIFLAQYTPSACNRQGWRTRIIQDKTIMESVMHNQNGNQGFGHEFDKLLVITADLRTEQKDREVFQAFIDGGMYAEGVINALFYYGIGCVPLSASLTDAQESRIRVILKLHDAEMMILFLGVGSYPKKTLTTRSERRPAEIEVI